MPEAEPAVADLRSRHDPSAAWGIPAHVTVLYPFVAAGDLDEATGDALAALFSGFPRFRCRFPRVGRFRDVVYLNPEPDAPFRALTEAVFARWPDHPPYEGAHDDVVPHLTVGNTEDTAVLEQVGQALAPLLPIAADVTAIELWTEQATGHWRRERRFPLRRA